MVPEDIKKLSEPVFAHRSTTTPSMSRGGKRNELIRGIVESIEVPTEEWDK